MTRWGREQVAVAPPTEAPALGRPSQEWRGARAPPYTIPWSLYTEIGHPSERSAVAQLSDMDWMEEVLGLKLCDCRVYQRRLGLLTPQLVWSRGGRLGVRDVPEGTLLHHSKKETLVLLTPAQTVTCQQCSGSADSCEPPAGTCTAETAKGGCITVAEENTLQGTKTTGLSRGCLNDFTGVTKGPVTVTLGNGKYVRINITQCSTETCNSPVLDVPTGSTTANGLQCPTCFSLNADPCNSSVTPCTGDETYCIDFAGTIRRGKFCQLAAVRELPRESHGSGTPQRAGET
ncbi:phospholipase A2 inhibitor and Ly6/PLAUR domain-containing protein-like [Gopherus evgoodei]|uniref:phospholipase A2 inhibitor and Ly6/PLAUR domain-containing protein-like n=1 Tax=Gopherus evgoodei TaxID=1825980 RepID=UPI0011CFE9AC|nr:phospholipase A2 inhibitor and Ly6/PLAUR domain-containing protein-like [Gopherus evgoodei]